ncbi:MAG: hypothetical protein ABW165_02605 [Candidatus Thiodiazotropha sp.]
MFELLIKILPLAKGAYNWLVELNDKEKQQFASICENIIKLLASYSNASDNERLSRNLCGELRVYVPEIKEMANNILEENQLNDMDESLDGVCNAWANHSKKHNHNSTISDSDLNEIDVAAGHFRALANIVRGF